MVASPDDLTEGELRELLKGTPYNTEEDCIGLSDLPDLDDGDGRESCWQSKLYGAIDDIQLSLREGCCEDELSKKVELKRWHYAGFCGGARSEEAGNLLSPRLGEERVKGEEGQTKDIDQTANYIKKLWFEAEAHDDAVQPYEIPGDLPF